MRQIPFQYGKVVYGQDFTDRAMETRHLANNFMALTNTAIISPRRWGKSSLVEHVIRSLSSDKGILFVRLNAFGCKSPEEFYAMLAKGVMRDLSSSLENLMSNAKEFLVKLAPKISLSDPTGQYDISFGIGYESEGAYTPDILDLPQRLAEKRGCNVVVCIDEFQNIAEFDDPIHFQRKLRAHWQKHQKASYCLYGSKRHMMLEVFSDSAMPFYKFGDLFFLNKIDTAHFVSFISERFSSTGKTITEDACRIIIDLADNHPYYVQQLSQLSWLRSPESCTEEVVVKAHASLVEQLSLLFSNLVETLTFQQVCYLHAVISGEKAITSAETMHKYHISSATAASRSLKTLIKKDILDNTADKVSFQDPIFQYWLKHFYFQV